MKFCICKATFDELKEYGDMACELCQQPFHSVCVGWSISEPYTCEPCQQKHNCARSTCVCQKFDDLDVGTSPDMQDMEWVSCDVCQTWFHKTCVSHAIQYSGFRNEINFVCSKCDRSHMDILKRDLGRADLEKMKIIFHKMCHLKHIWPIKVETKNISELDELNLKVIDFKLNNSCYHCFKDFMEDMINMISKFRDYYGIHGMENKKETKCCEIVEYDFSNFVREYMLKGGGVNRVGNPVSLGLRTLQNIKQQEMRLQDRLAS